MTFSIVARDPETGDLAVAVASKFLAAGSVVSWGRAGVGAIATQALANTSYGPNGLKLLAEGMAAADVLKTLTDNDDGRDQRQAGIVDAQGRSATYTGKGCIDWAGGRTLENIAAQGNILAGPSVVDAMIDAFTAPGLPFPERMVEALKAADAQGGDRRGRQSAALLVRRAGAGYGGHDDNWIDLRVDDDTDPMHKLAYILSLTRLYRDRPNVEDLVAIDDGLANELRTRLAAAGYSPDKINKGRSLAELIEEMGVERTGQPRDVPDGWDMGWESALAEWMSVENLEERMTARGWSDPRVVEHLRHLSKA